MYVHTHAGAPESSGPFFRDLDREIAGNAPLAAERR